MRKEKGRVLKKEREERKRDVKDMDECILGGMNASFL